MDLITSILGTILFAGKYIHNDLTEDPMTVDEAKEKIRKHRIESTWLEEVKASKELEYGISKEVSGWSENAKAVLANISEETGLEPDDVPTFWVTRGLLAMQGKIHTLDLADGEMFAFINSQLLQWYDRELQKHGVKEPLVCYCFKDEAPYVCFVKDYVPPEYVEQHYFWLPQTKYSETVDKWKLNETVFLLKKYKHPKFMMRYWIMVPSFRDKIFAQKMLDRKAVDDLCVLSCMVSTYREQEYLKKRNRRHNFRFAEARKSMQFLSTHMGKDKNFWESLFKLDS